VFNTSFLFYSWIVLTKEKEISTLGPPQCRVQEHGARKKKGDRTMCLGATLDIV